MNDEYLTFYRILGVEPGCSWTELKLAYRRLVRRWHPDHQKPGSSTSDDAQIKAVNTAFEALAGYYQRHGELPFLTPESPAELKGDSETTTIHSPSDFAASSSPYSSRRPNRGNPMRFALIGAAIAIVYAMFTNLFLREDANRTSGYTTPRSGPNLTPQLQATTPSKSSNPGPTSANDSSAPPIAYFKPGSTIGEVIATQGPPTQMGKDTWYYGKSRVYFHDGHVTHWEEDDANPLNARLLPTAPSPSNAIAFGIGSTKPDVRAAQGSPILETENMWDYGASRVYFTEGRVTGWEESPMRPLHLRR